MTLDNKSYINKNAYLTFDGKSIRDVIIDRLNQESLFTDQNYQGSNLSAFIDIISFSFSTLLYYLNKTSSESMFSESQIYENMNRIIKILNYKPIGKLGQTVPFTLTVDNLQQGSYTIPRYSYLRVGNLTFSFPTDISFSKFEIGTEEIEDLRNKNILKEGKFLETPIYIANGMENEILFLNLSENISIDHFEIQVYVKRAYNNFWEEWKRIDDLYLAKTNDEVYEVRYNHNKNYEIKFGDDVNGSKLNKGDSVIIFYLSIDTNSTTIGPNSLQSSSVIPYNSLYFNEILKDTASQLGEYLTSTNLPFLRINNDFTSTLPQLEETVEEIREKAPKFFRLQNRLITSNDFETYIETNFPNLVSDVMVINNEEYLNSQIKYYYELGISKPQLENNILLNQVNFGTSCNFNNIYTYVVPKNEFLVYLTEAQKDIIKNQVQELKPLTSNIMFVDPIYMLFDFYLPINEVDPEEIPLTKLYIYKKPNTKRSSASILFDVENVFKNNFNKTVNKLGQEIDLYKINSEILTIDGIDYITTKREDTNTEIEGISFLCWNSDYPELDAKVYSQNFILELFQYPIFNDIQNIKNRIVIFEKSEIITSTQI
jgi:acetyltransferase-like isoleucine patch superfamily enzyme